jgi:Ino eighty subunit 2
MFPVIQVCRENRLLYSISPKPSLVRGLVDSRSIQYSTHNYSGTGRCANLDIYNGLQGRSQDLASVAQQDTWCHVHWSLGARRRALIPIEHSAPRTGYWRNHAWWYPGQSNVQNAASRRRPVIVIDSSTWDLAGTRLWWENWYLASEQQDQIEVKSAPAVSHIEVA